MTLFHGSNMVVAHPDVAHSKRNIDAIRAGLKFIGSYNPSEAQ